MDDTLENWFAREILAHEPMLVRYLLRVWPNRDALGLNVGDSQVPVAAFALKTEESMRALQARLESEGLFVLHTRYIGSGSGGVIRCGIFADHTIEHLDTLLDALRRIL